MAEKVKFAIPDLQQMVQERMVQLGDTFTYIHSTRLKNDFFAHLPTHMTVIIKNKLHIVSKSDTDRMRCADFR